MYLHTRKGKVTCNGEFPEWRTILLDIEAIGNIPVCYTMEDTINTALNLIHG